MNDTQITPIKQPPTADPAGLTDADLHYLSASLAPILPSPPGHLLTWTGLCGHVPYLRRHRGTGQIAEVPPVSDSRKAELLAMLADPVTRDAVCVLLGLDSIGGA